MGQAMAGDLVPRLADAPHQRRMAPGNPAQGKEGTSRIGGSKKIENAGAIILHARGKAVPLGRVDHALERANLEPFLDIDRKAVGNRHENPRPADQAAAFWSASSHSINMASERFTLASCSTMRASIAVSRCASAASSACGTAGAGAG